MLICCSGRVRVAITWHGHLISSECSLLESVQPGVAPELPEDFAAKHSKETTGVDDPTKFYTKREYLDLMDKVQAATFAALDKTSDSDFDQAGPESFRQMFPTVGHLYLLIATHQLMHAGQFVPVRRKLGKPVVI